MEDLIFPNTNLGLLAQLAVAMVLGVFLGAERSIAGKTAGMRTYALVTMGSCLFIIISISMGAAFLGVVHFDPLRMSSAVITGIGFIGAGIIIFRDRTLRGLTTAAGLWVAAGIGMAVGFKLYTMAIFATFLTLFVFTALWFVEDFIENKWKLFMRHRQRALLVKDQTEKVSEQRG